MNVLKEDELIYIKLEYDELVEAKRRLLIFQMSLLKLTQRLRKYGSLRSLELEKKQNLHKIIKETGISIRTLQVTLPKLKIPEIIKKEEKKKEVQKIELLTDAHYEDQNLENQLRDIQNKLNSL